MLVPLIFVHHIESVGLFLPVIHGAAALLRRSVGVALLGLLLDLVTGIAARGRPGDGRESPPGAATDLMTQDAADYRAQAGAEYLILVFHRLGVRDGFIMTLLAGNFDRPRQRLSAEDPGRVRACVHLVPTDRATGGHHNGPGQQTCHKGLCHPPLLIHLGDPSGSDSRAPRRVSDYRIMLRWP